jgi:hypothetical protein
MIDSCYSYVPSSYETPVIWHCYVRVRLSFFYLPTKSTHSDRSKKEIESFGSIKPTRKKKKYIYRAIRSSIKPILGFFFLSDLSSDRRRLRYYYKLKNMCHARFRTKFAAKKKQWWLACRPDGSLPLSIAPDPIDVPFVTTLLPPAPLFVSLQILPPAQSHEIESFRSIKPSTSRLNMSTLG